MEGWQTELGRRSHLLSIFLAPEGFILFLPRQIMVCPTIGRLSEKQQVTDCRIYSQESEEHTLSCPGQSPPTSPHAAAADAEVMQQCWMR